MGVFDMVALIVIVGCLAGVLITRIRTRDPVDVDLDGYEGRIDDLESCIQVLEQVVTDDRLIARSGRWTRISNLLKATVLGRSGFHVRFASRE